MLELPPRRPRAEISQQGPEMILLTDVEASEVEVEFSQRRHQVNGIDDGLREPELFFDAGRITRRHTPTLDGVGGLFDGLGIYRDGRLPVAVRIKRESDGAVILT